MVLARPCLLRGTPAGPFLSPRPELVEREVWKHELHIRCDWFTLLHDLVEGRRGLADELLAQLNRDRQPSLAHLMLAHLTRRLGWRLLLTLNHDSLLERAFISEGLDPKVFDVNALSGVPDAALLQREPLSIVKLHGSAYGLRLGESTNDELDETTRDRLLGYIPRRAVLLVVGFSGYERRMMSVIESIVAMDGAKHGRGPEIVWMHWESEDRLAEQVKRLQDRLELISASGLLRLHRLDDAGLFLKGLYQRMTRTLPSTRTRYNALPKRVMNASKPNNSHEQTPAKCETAPPIDAEQQKQQQVSPPKDLAQETVRLFARESLFGPPRSTGEHSSARAARPGAPPSVAADADYNPQTPYMWLVRPEIEAAGRRQWVCRLSGRPGG